MKLLLSLNKYTSVGVLFLLSVVSKIMGTPWIYQIAYFLFTIPDYSIQGFLLNLSTIIILSFLIIILGIIKGIISLKEKF
ncbi:MAG: hypothetical protein RRE78_07570 [Acidianus sp.]|nr:hypothetical protein [Acidianus sp.]